MNTTEMLRLSWRGWLSRSETQVGPWWLDHLWTVLFSLAVALVFATLFSLDHQRSGITSWWAWYGVSAVVSLCIGFSVRFAFWISTRVIGRPRLNRAEPWQRSLYFFLTPALGVLFGWPIGVYLATGIDLRRMLLVEHPEAAAGSVLVALVITALFQQFFWSKARQIRAENAATEAQLRLLQAQIEPHFLFNTLANVTALMESDAPRAKLMLESFVDYLRASLSGLGDAQHTLGDELDLVGAYLRIVKIRMEDRLAYEVDVPDSLRALPLPALTLQPLVENAVLHGLEPQIEGGHLHIGARREGRSLVITVDDDGGGLAVTTSTPTVASSPRTARGGTGTALANIRHRLLQTYGSSASLRVEPAPVRGVRASLSLPVPMPLPA